MVASATASAPSPSWDPPPCPGVPASGTARIGAWFRLDPILEDGVIVGQDVSMGWADRPVPWRIRLEAESFASGPTAGTVVVGTDDGHASTLSLIDLQRGCGWTLGTSADVIRNGVLGPDGAIVESRVDRRTRADLGVWRRPLDGSAPSRLLAPLRTDARFGPTWATDLGWSDDGATLVVASCGEVACRYRLQPLAGGPVAAITDPTLGTVVGLADGRLVTRGACRGLPCPVVSIRPDGSDRVVLDDAAGLAVLARDDADRGVVVHELAAGSTSLRSVRPDGRDGRVLPAAPPGLRLVADAAWTGGATEHPPDLLVFAPDGLIPGSGVRSARLRAVATDTPVSILEVSR
jgi:hypothetical protein